MAQLLFSTPTFRPDGSSVENVPMLLDARMRLVEPACAWLMHVALVRGRTRSPQTWRTYAEALYDWWQTLGRVDKFEPISRGGEMDHAEEAVASWSYRVAIARLILSCPNIRSMRLRCL